MTAPAATRQRPGLKPEDWYGLEQLARQDCTSALTTAPGRVRNTVLWKLTRIGLAERVDDNPRDAGCRYRITSKGSQWRTNGAGVS